MEALKKVGFAGLTCTFALCGAGIGTVTGALKGQTTETGISRGAFIGAVAGAVVAVELLDSCLQGDLSKVAIFGSLFNGKIFVEWVSPAMFKAYQWQDNSVEATYGEIHDMFDINLSKGLVVELIKKLPELKITSPCGEVETCSVCLQDLKWGESARKLPTCGHIFHLACIDAWLMRNATCPFCRNQV